MDPREQQRIEAYLSIIEGRGVIDGRFTNLRRIDPIGGGGTFSLIVTADDLITGESVVLKFFHPDRYTPADSYRWDSFERESKLLEELGECRDVIKLVSGQSEFLYPVPGIIPFDIRFSFYAMEKASSSLESELTAGNLSTEAMLLVFRGLTRAIQHTHSKRIAHRDIKPANIQMTDSGPKLSDFGTARKISDSIPPISSAYSWPPGDLTYVAPEMMACLHDVDPGFSFLGDFFSLGATLFEMFTRVQLGVVLFGPQLLSSLTLPMVTVPRDQRVTIFNRIIGSVVSRYQLPTIESLNPSVSPCVRQRLNALYKDLCNLDYRQRLCSFSSVFRGIDTCLLILRNEARYATWLEEKRKRRAARLLRLSGGSR